MRLPSVHQLSLPSIHRSRANGFPRSPLGVSCPPLSGLLVVNKEGQGWGRAQIFGPFHTQFSGKHVHSLTPTIRCPSHSGLLVVDKEVPGRGRVQIRHVSCAAAAALQHRQRSPVLAISKVGGRAKGNVWAYPEMRDLTMIGFVRRFRTRGPGLECGGNQKITHRMSGI